MQQSKQGMQGLRAKLGMVQTQPQADNLPAVAGQQQGQQQAEQGAQNPRGVMARLNDPMTQARFAAVIPRNGLTVNRFMGALATEIKRNPKLLECGISEVLGAAIRIAELGLVPGAGLGHAYILPFKGKAQVILGYKGMIELAYRNQTVASINAYPVFVGDTFDFYEDETGPKLLFKPDLLNPNRGRVDKLMLVWARARMASGESVIVYMTRAEIDVIRSRGNAKSNPVWTTDYEEMAIKTVIRRLFKRLPVSVEAQQAAALDDVAAMGDDQQNGAAYDGDDATDVDFSDAPRGNAQGNAQVTNAADAAGFDDFDYQGGQQQQAGAPHDQHDDGGPEPLTTDFDGVIATDPGASPLETKIRGAMARAQSLDTLDIAADEIRELADPTRREQLAEFYRERRAQFD